MSKRRDFIRQTIYLVGYGALANTPVKVFASQPTKSLCILHTNDWHSRIEPFPDFDRNFGGQGGALGRAALIRKIRRQEGEILLLDSGDIFQGTPYFNFYGGELEYKLMSAMGYDCTTLGNHDFDAGIEGLVKQMPHASFSFVNGNYDFSGTALEGIIQPYQIFRKNGIRIGVFGLGIELSGLVPDKLYGSIRYHDPILAANRIATELKKKKKCDLVVCLSHLGYKYNNGKVSDEKLAAMTSNIDLILGGHTHTFLPEPVEYLNKDRQKVLVNQVGWAGLQVGQIKYTFEPFAKSQLAASASIHFLTNIQQKDG